MARNGDYSDERCSRCPPPIKDACIQRSVLGFFIGEHPMKRFNSIREYAQGYYDVLFKSTPVSDVLEYGERRKSTV